MIIRALLIFLMTSMRILAVESSVAICAIFHDDAKYLPEWIEFHEKQGVSHFYLYNNLSTDNYKDILKGFVDRGLVEIIDWPYPSSNGTDWNVVQCNSYKDGVRRCGTKYTWCAFLDTDEFLFAVDKTPLNVYLNQYRSYPGIMVNWIMYGTSGVSFIAEGQKLVDLLVFRAKMDFQAHKSYKSIVQPTAVIDCFNPHWFIYRHSQLGVDENKIRRRPEDMQSSVTKLRINHYWSRDLDFFINVKIPRRVKWYPDEYQRCYELEALMNAEYDPILATQN